MAFELQNPGLHVRGVPRRRPDPVAPMFGNLGLGEILIILVLVLILFGPKKIPELAGTVGRGINEFRRHVGEAQRAVTDPLRGDFTPSPPPPPTYTLGAAPPPLTEEEEQARQPKRLLE